MANTKGSDNPFPSILVVEGTEPTAPSAGQQRLYIDSTTHKLKRTDSSGTDVTIESAGGGSLTVEEVDGSPTDSAVTKLVLPNGTLAIASHVATYTPAAGSYPGYGYNAVATDQGTTSGSFTDLATTGPTVTLTINTAVKVTLSADMYSAGAAVGAHMGVALSSANTAAAADTAKLFGYVDGNGLQKSRVITFTGLTPGSTVFTAKYYSGSGSISAHFRYRSMLVERLD